MLSMLSFLFWVCFVLCHEPMPTFNESSIHGFQPFELSSEAVECPKGLKFVTSHDGKQPQRWQ